MIMIMISTRKHKNWDKIDNICNNQALITYNQLFKLQLFWLCASASVRQKEED